MPIGAHAPIASLFFSFIFPSKVVAGVGGPAYLYVCDIYVYL